MRKEPAHRSEMVSQLLFGEFAAIGHEDDQFVQVTSHHDGYTGWVQKNQICKADRMVQPIAYTPQWVSEVMIDGEVIRVPFSTPFFEPQAFFESTGKTIHYMADERLPLTTTFSEDNLVRFANMYSGSPYLWGGRSVFGIDCSGFVQQVFKLVGVRLRRDAYLQAEEGETVQSLTASRAGDLAFFRNDKNRITHVGIILSNSKIVHASGRVRIDHLNDDGIVNSSTGEITHKWACIKRMSV